MGGCEAFSKYSVGRFTLAGAVSHPRAGAPYLVRFLLLLFLLLLPSSSNFSFLGDVAFGDEEGSGGRGRRGGGGGFAGLETDVENVQDIAVHVVESHAGCLGISAWEDKVGVGGRLVLEGAFGLVEIAASAGGGLGCGGSSSISSSGVAHGFLGGRGQASGAGLPSWSYCVRL